MRRLKRVEIKITQTTPRKLVAKCQLTALPVFVYLSSSHKCRVQSCRILHKRKTNSFEIVFFFSQFWFRMFVPFRFVDNTRVFCFLFGFISFGLALVISETLTLSCNNRFQDNLSFGFFLLYILFYFVFLFFFLFHRFVKWQCRPVQLLLHLANM